MEGVGVASDIKTSEMYELNKINAAGAEDL